MSWFKQTSDGGAEGAGARQIVRHPLNQRKVGSVARQYMQKICDCGIVEGVRGEAWLVRDEATNQFLALTYGTLPPACARCNYHAFCSAAQQCAARPGAREFDA